MSIVHFATVQCLTAPHYCSIPHLRSSPEWQDDGLSCPADSLFRLLTQLIQCKKPPAMPSKPAPSPEHEASALSQVAALEEMAVAPLLKLNHRTSIEDRLYEDADEAGLDAGVLETEADNSASSGIIVSISSAASSTQVVFDCSEYLTYEHLDTLFSHRDAELAVYAAALLCKYLWHEQQCLTRHNVLRLFASATLVTFKMNFDRHPDLLAYLAGVFGVDPSTVLALERQFCKGIGYDMSVDQSLLDWVKGEMLP